MAKRKKSDGDKKTKRKDSEKLKQRGKKIISLAKEIRSNNPDKPWKVCVSEAAKQLKKSGELKSDKL